MASPRDASVHFPTARLQKKKKHSGHLKREELEQEVSKLHKMLSHEEKVHEALESTLYRNNGSSIHIPNFLPPKTKELLAELAMVEGEICRLESQINHLQLDLNQEKEVTKKSKSKEWQHGALNNRHGHSLAPPSQTQRAQERMAFEAKALYYINKAIKGNCILNDFTINESVENYSRGITHQNENHSHEEVGLQGKVSRKSGIQKTPSPMRPPRHSTSVPVERGPESALQSSPLSNSSQLDDNSQNWQPNKLSENIMKCLNFIFVRLIRTSRTMEIEKSGTISRSVHSSLISRSFRADANLNANHLLQKEYRQQDPYDIFYNEDSVPRDIGPYKNFVRFTSSSLDPKSLSSSSSTSLLQKLRVLVNKLQDVDLSSLSYQQKLAFWINMYNACVMHGFLQYGVPSSPEKLLAMMKKATLNIGGNKINALAIENFILRQPRSSNIKEVFRKVEKDDKEAIVRSIYGLESPDPNVTFALCCGTKSSPAVRIYTADGVMTELEKSKLEYLQASIVVTNTKRLGIPELLLQNMFDFAVDVDSLIQWICLQLPASGSLRKSMVECFRALNGGKILSIIDKIRYDFEFQYLLAI